jgi:hypothetical protein
MIQNKNMPGAKTRDNNHKQRTPENKDDLDSRKNEEWDTKGDDVTHNRKEIQSERKKKKA